MPFPSDLLTVADPAQRTGLRIALPRPSCRALPSVCQDLALLNELDGFDLAPRLVLPFSGPIDPASVTARSLFLVRLGAGPPEAIAVDRLVYDPENHTLYARPEVLLDPETRYGLVVTRELRDAAGRAVADSGAFRHLLGGAEAARVPAAYRRALGQLRGALARRGVSAADVAVASVFTTGSVSSFLEQAREALDRQPPPPPLMNAPDEGGRAYFPRGDIRELFLRRQVRLEGSAPDAFRETRLPLEALPPAHVAGLGIGWYWSPSYLTPDRRIAEGPTGRPARGPVADVPIPFVVVLPAGPRPPAGWPVALMGHGYGGEMLSSALCLAGTLARHGIATVAITVVGHGGGPESRLVVRRVDGTTSTVPIPGRGVDLDGDGRIDAIEGLSPVGPLESLSLRDGLRQQVVDLMALVRALGHGLDADGDGDEDTGRQGAYYVGQSLGGIYGTMLLAVDPRVEVGVLNVAGGPIIEIARLSAAYRPRVRAALARRFPPLVTGDGDFREELPLAGEPPVIRPGPEALAIQEYLARVEWLGRRGDPVAYARHLRTAPLVGQPVKRVLLQLARGDGVVPNPTSASLVRAGQLADVTALVRYDRVAPAVGAQWQEPHGFLLRVGGPELVDALARAAQEQVARFFRSDGTLVWNPDEERLLPVGPVFEIPAAALIEPGLARPAAAVR